LDYYCKWQYIAESGYDFIPKRYLIPVKTASEMYNWTADQINKNPFLIYKKKVKPQISQILQTTVMNIIDPKINLRKSKKTCKSYSTLTSN
jgi:phytoene synthase